MAFPCNIDQKLIGCQRGKAFPCIFSNQRRFYDGVLRRCEVPSFTLDSFNPNQTKKSQMGEGNTEIPGELGENNLPSKMLLLPLFLMYLKGAPKKKTNTS